MIPCLLQAVFSSAVFGQRSNIAYRVPYMPIHWIYRSDEFADIFLTSELPFNYLFTLKFK